MIGTIIKSGTCRCTLCHGAKEITLPSQLDAQQPLLWTKRLRVTRHITRLEAAQAFEFKPAQLHNLLQEI
jgi:hypothetical protein